MSTVPKSILVVGATGWVGHQVTHALLEKRAFDVSIMVREESRNKKDTTLDDLKAKGAKIVTGDIYHLSHVVSALKESKADTIVSTLSGPALFEGMERNLVKAAEEVDAVRRIVPSQFGIDISVLDDPGELTVKSDLVKDMEVANIEYTLIVNGWFQEFAFTKICGWDVEAGNLVAVGDGNVKFSTTSVANVAKFVPEILLDPKSKNQTIHLAGETLTHHQAKTIFETIYGRKFNMIYKDLETLKKEYETASPSAKAIPWLQMQMLANNRSINFEGFTDNWRYPNVLPITVKEWASSHRSA
jgi:uncharacterized protein YbjT (DUF2867 family)